MQNWTGTNGVLESYAEGKLVQRFLKIDKMSTVSEATAPFRSEGRSGYGYIDENLNFTVDPGEQKRYCEVSVAINSIFSRMTTNRQLPALYAYHHYCSRTPCSHLLFPLWQACLGDPSTSLRCALRKPEVNWFTSGVYLLMQGGANLSTQLRYPLGTHHADDIRTATGKPLTELTFDNVIGGKISAEDLRIAPETLEKQAVIAEQAGRPQLAENFRRAAELTAVPDARILEIYNALRPGASTYEQLVAIADELERKFSAKRNAALVRDAAEVYRRRNCLAE